jgi:hypothetical protein
MNKGLLLALGALILIASVTLVVIKKTTPDAQKEAVQKVEEKTDKVTVNANNGQFEPKDFTIDLFDKLILNVTAVDRDYTFKIAGYPRLDTVIAKGQTALVEVKSLGVDKYNYTCGTGCSGTITVNQRVDAE